MTSVIQQLSPAVVVINGKNDYITPGNQNYGKFPVAVSVEPSAHMNDIIVLRLQTLKFPRMVLCFDLRSFHFCLFSSSLLESVLFVFPLIVPCFNFTPFIKCTCFSFLQKALCSKLGSMADYSDSSYRDFPKSLRKMQQLHIKLGHNTSFLHRFPCVYSVHHHHHVHEGLGVFPVP
jgi:hypothetical protein